MNRKEAVERVSEIDRREKWIFLRHPSIAYAEERDRRLGLGIWDGESVLFAYF